MWVAIGVAGAVVVGLAMWGVIADNRAHPAGTGSAPTSGQSPVSETKVVTARDQKSQLTVPTSWEDAPAAFKNEHATLQVGEARREQYILIVSASDVDFDNFAGFSEACLEEARTLLEGAEIGEARQVTIGGLAAVQHVITGKASGFKIAFWYTMIEGKRGFYQVVGWTLPSKKAEAEPTILKVIDSFREIGPA